MSDKTVMIGDVVYCLVDLSPLDSKDTRIETCVVNRIIEVDTRIMVNDPLTGNNIVTTVYGRDFETVKQEALIAIDDELEAIRKFKDGTIDDAQRFYSDAVLRHREKMRQIKASEER